MAGGHAWQGACMAGEMATAVGGTHSTGMHSCTCRILNTGPCGEWLHALQGTDRQNQIGMPDNITFQQNDYRKETTVNIRRLSNGMPDSYLTDITLWRMTPTNYL